MGKFENAKMAGLPLRHAARATSPKQGRSTLDLMGKVIFGAPMLPSASWFVMCLASWVMRQKR